MMQKTLRIVSRESPLAMWQAKHVRQALLAELPAIDVDIIGITTEADIRLESSLEELGGKGAFVKELEQALLNGDADLAVHSMKDVSIELPKGLEVPVVLKREDPRDVMISNNYHDFDSLPQGACVGTSSLRRRAQLLAARPDLEIRDIRGNVGTRLQKLENQGYDALVLAAAGLIRLGLEDRISAYFSTDRLLPAVSQGVLGIEICSENENAREMLTGLIDSETWSCVSAERALNRQLGGDCHVPIAALGERDGSRLRLRAMVGSLDGSRIIRVAGEAEEAQAEHLGQRLGQSLLQQGAGEILAEARNKGAGD